MKAKDVTNFLGITQTDSQGASIASSGGQETLRTQPPVGETKTLFTWRSLSRVVKPVNKRLTKNFIVIAVVVALLLIAMQEYMLVVLIASTIFLSYVLASAPAEDVAYAITNHGLLVSGRLYYWPDLKHYFFEERNNGTFLCVDVKEGLPGRLYLNINSQNKDTITKLMDQFLPHIDASPKTFLDKAYFSVVDKVSFEKKEDNKNGKSQI